MSNEVTVLLSAWNAMSSRSSDPVIETETVPALPKVLPTSCSVRAGTSAVVVVVLVVLPMVNPDAGGSAQGVILLIAVFGAVISYIMQMVSFVLLRRKFPNASRPYKSPTGVAGAVVAGIIAVGALLGILLNSAFLTAVVTFLVIFVVGIVLFALIGRNTLVLSPEEEYALSGGLHEHPPPPLCSSRSLSCPERAASAEGGQGSYVSDAPATA